VSDQPQAVRSESAGPAKLRRQETARGGRLGRTKPTADRAAGRTRTADAAARARPGRAQIHAARDAGAAARCVEPGCCGLSVGARLFSEPDLYGLAVRTVLVAGLHRWRPLRGRGFLRAECVRLRYVARLTSCVCIPRPPIHGLQFPLA